MGEVIDAVLFVRLRGFGRGDFTAIRHGDARRSFAAVTAHIEYDGDHFFLALRRGGKRQQRNAEHKYQKHAEQTFFHIIPSLRYGRFTAYPKVYAYGLAYTPGKYRIPYGPPVCKHKKRRTEVSVRRGKNAFYPKWLLSDNIRRDAVKNPLDALIVVQKTGFL